MVNINPKRFKLAFTFVELMLVVAIVGILASLSVVGLKTVRGKSRDLRRVNDIKVVQEALQFFKEHEKRYPTTAEFVIGRPLIGPSSNQVYLTKIPTNPFPRTDGGCPGSEYYYEQLIGGRSYALYYCLGSKTGLVTAGLNQASPSNIGTPYIPYCEWLPVGNTGANPQPECDKCVCGDCSTLSCDGLSNFQISSASCLVKDTTYKAVKVGNQCWLDRNINIGSMILSGASMNNDPVLEKWCYDNNQTNCTNEGGFYFWSEAMYLPSTCNVSISGSCDRPAYLTGTGINAKRQGICPKGWHVPSDYEFSVLENYLDSAVLAPATPNLCNNTSHSFYADNRCDDTTLSYWMRGTNSPGGVADQLKPSDKCSGVSPNCGRSNLNMVMTGYLWGKSVFYDQGDLAMFWTSTVFSTANAYSRYIETASSQSERHGSTKANDARAVRCVKD